MSTPLTSPDPVYFQNPPSTPDRLLLRAAGKDGSAVAIVKRLEETEGTSIQIEVWERLPDGYIGQGNPVVRWRYLTEAGLAAIAPTDFSTLATSLNPTTIPNKQLVIDPQSEEDDTNL